jgi:hypothetical protein
MIVYLLPRKRKRGQRRNEDGIGGTIGVTTTTTQTSTSLARLAVAEVVLRLCSLCVCVRVCSCRCGNVLIVVLLALALHELACMCVMWNIAPPVLRFGGERKLDFNQDNRADS